MMVVRETLSALFSILVFPGLAFAVICALTFEWLDRLIMARLQGRVGPPWYQPVADLIKLLAKEESCHGRQPTPLARLPLLSLLRCWRPPCTSPWPATWSARSKAI